MWVVEISRPLIDCCSLFASATHCSLKHFCYSSIVALSITEQQQKASSTADKLCVSAAVTKAWSQQLATTPPSTHPESLSTASYLARFTNVIKIFD